MPSDETPAPPTRAERLKRPIPARAPRAIAAELSTCRLVILALIGIFAWSTAPAQQDRSRIGPCRDDPAFERFKEQERARYGSEAACVREADLSLRSLCEVPGKKLCSDEQRATLRKSLIGHCEWIWGWGLGGSGC